MTRHAMERFVTQFLCFALLLGSAAATAGAAEMRVRAECSPERSIVTLGDLVDLRCESTSEAERLARITLFPAPAPGMRRFVSSREIKDMLLVRGIDLIEHDFRGAASVLVVGAELRQEATTNVRLLTSSPQLAQRKMHKALGEHLARAADEPWEVKFQLSEDAARWIGAAETLSIQNGEKPTSGRHCFEVTLQVGDEQKTLDVVAEISLPPLVVVPVRSIPRQTRIRPADLELRRLDESRLNAASIRRVEDLVGKETTRNLAVGKPIDRSCVCEPVLVRRGDTVSVLVRAAGVRVRATARARDNGAKGDLVAVESLSDRKTYFAHVSGVREVEILATAVTARDSNRTQPNPG